MVVDKKNENIGRNKGYANLIPAKPGEVRNPKGRGHSPNKIPRTFKLFAALVCSQPNWQEKIKNLSERGNARAIEAILHYGEGKPADTVNVNVESHEDFIKRLIKEDDENAK